MVCDKEQSHILIKRWKINKNYKGVIYLKKVSVLLAIFFILVTINIPAQADSDIIFEMEDPRGDADGDGNYTHPTADEFATELKNNLI